jgi:hypothetical protein
MEHCNLPKLDNVYVIKRVKTGGKTHHHRDARVSQEILRSSSLLPLDSSAGALSADLV